jgi:hypothetical protein
MESRKPDKENDRSGETGSPENTASAGRWKKSMEEGTNH